MEAMHGAAPSVKAAASDEAIDAIAEIEVMRRGMEKDAGLAASCSAALRKLHELLERETEALQQHGSGGGHPRNVETVAAEIERVRGLAVVTGPGPAPRNTYPDQKKVSWQYARRNSPRNKGRRTMGRGGGR
jgi:hypothetical protein